MAVVGGANAISPVVCAVLCCVVLPVLCAVLWCVALTVLCSKV
jgi:hypothetical protein